MKKLKSVAAVMLAMMLAVVFAACGKNDPVIKVGNDEIPSLYSVVGTRKISGVSSGIDNGVRYSTKTYPKGAVSTEDIEQYFDYLHDEAGFITTMDYTQKDGVVTVQLAKESVDDSKIVLVDIEHHDYDTTVITYQVFEGTLTIY